MTLLGFFVNEVDDLKEAKRSEVHQAVESVFARYSGEVCRYFAVIASLRPLGQGKTDHPGIHDLHLQFQGAFVSFTFRVQTVGQWLQPACAGRSLGEGDEDVQKPSWH